MAYKIEKKKFTKDVSFNKAKQNFKSKKEIVQLYNNLSTKIVHLNESQSTRAYETFEINGKTYPRIGMAIDTDGTKYIMGELARAILYLVRILSDFYNSKCELVGEEYFNKKNILEKRYSELQNSN